MATCGIAKRPFAIRTEKSGSRYIMDWTFIIDENRSKEEGFEQNMVSGSFDFGEEYPGCPHCGAMSWYECGSCKSIVCYNGKDQTIKCPKCGNEGELTNCDSFDLSGGTI